MRKTHNKLQHNTWEYRERNYEAHTHGAHVVGLARPFSYPYHTFRCTAVILTPGMSLSLPLVTVVERNFIGQMATRDVGRATAEHGLSCI